VDSPTTTAEKTKFSYDINNIVKILAHLEQFKQITQMVKTM
jgi:hypothetical protein